MIALCSTGGAYSHVFGTCMREAREWEQRKLFFHRWSANACFTSYRMQCVRGICWFVCVFVCVQAQGILS